MKITATIKWQGHTMNLAWEDGKLTGDDVAVRLADVADWELHQPPCGPLTKDPRKNPYAVALVFEATFDEVLSMEGEPELPPGDLLSKPWDSAKKAWTDEIMKNLGWVAGPNAQWQRAAPAVDHIPDRAPTLSLVPAAQPPFAQDVPRFKTKDEAYQWLAKNVGVRSVSDDRLNLEELQELADGCYPAVRDFKGQLGSMSIKTTGAGKCLAKYRDDSTLLLNQTYRKNQAAREAQNIDYFEQNKVRIIKTLQDDIALRGDPTGKLQSSLDAINSCTRWSTSMDSAYPIETLYAHEMGHRILRGDTYWAWETAVRKAGVTRNDKWTVSEYGAENGGSELFSEVHAFVSTGRKAELPRSISNAYDSWLAATYQRKGGS